MISIYSFEQVAEKLQLDPAELRFLSHHLWEFFSPTPADVYTRNFSGADVALLERVVQMQRTENLDLTTIRQNLRGEAGMMQLSRNRKASLLAFCCGRTGVGTSTLVWNLAAALAARGARCTIVDGSFGRGGVEASAGMTEANQWSRVLPSGVRLVNLDALLGSDGPEPRPLDEEAVKELRLLDGASDFILIDTGPGGSDTALRYAMMVDETIMVTTTDVGVNMDTYSIIRMLRDINPDLALGLVVNRAPGLGQAREAFSRINGAGMKLGLSEVPGLGWVIEDEAMRQSMERGEAITESLPGSLGARCINLLADVLVNRLTPPGQQSGGGLLELVRGLSTNFQRLQPVKGLSTTGI